MKQRINLYRIPPPEPFSFLSYQSAVVLVLLVWSLVGVGVSAYVVWGKSLLAELSSLQSQQATLEQQLSQHQAMLVNLKPDAVLLQQQQLIRQRIQSEQQLLGLIDSLERDQRKPFSTYMEGVAAADQPNVWLEQLEINLPLQTVKLAGFSTRGAEIPLMLSELSQQDAFRGVKVDQFELSPAPQNKNLHQFAIEAGLSGKRGYKVAK